jgi:exosome complex RNA-binding protein Rrp4
MNIVRIVISMFLGLLIVVAATGWIWVGSHQAAAQATASRVVLTLCIAAGVAGLTALWRAERPGP